MSLTALYRALLGREPHPRLVQVWRQARRVGQRIGRALISTKNRTAHKGLEVSLLPYLTDENFIIYVYLIVLDRFPSAAEIHLLADALATNGISREKLVLERLIVASGELRLQELGDTTNDTSLFYIMGTQRAMSIYDWHVRRHEGAESSARTTHASFPQMPRSREIDVTVICSLWRGGEYIERYMENITSQTVFVDRCELIVIDAASPENESAVIEHYRERFGHRIVYHRMPYRAGIYVAWNVGVALARGRYLTNANLDDLRRRDSLEIQAGVLDALPFVDVVYQDYLYSAASDATYDDVARAGVVSELPLVTPHTMFVTNPPHNAPMWRAALHDDIGFFDESYRSAGDYDFWLRALAAKKQFYKTNDPHVVYYYNPKGISTARNTRGLVEPRQALRRNGRAVMPASAIESRAAFGRRIGLSEWPSGPSGAPVSRYAAVQRRMRDLCGELRT